MANINPSAPGDTDIVSAYPASERASRAALLALLSGDAFGGGTTGGSANAQTLTVDNTGVTLVDGAIFWAKAGFTNTETVTLQVNSLSAKTCALPNGTDISASHPGAITTGHIYTFLYHGVDDRFYVLNASGYKDQKEYDQDTATQVGAVALRWDSTAPTVPFGVTATWTAITDTDRYLRINNAGGGGTGGSATTPLPNHAHNLSTTDVPTLPNDIPVNNSGTTTGQPTSNPDIDITPKFRDVRAYRRSA